MVDVDLDSVAGDVRRNSREVDVNAVVLPVRGVLTSRLGGHAHCHGGQQQEGGWKRMGRFSSGSAWPVPSLGDNSDGKSRIVTLK